MSDNFVVLFEGKIVYGPYSMLRCELWLDRVLGQFEDRYGISAAVRRAKSYRITEANGTSGGA